MVQRKVPSKLGIQAEHVKSDKRLANLKLSSSQHQDGKSRGADMKKKMKNSRLIKLSDLEALQSSSSSPSRRSFPQPGKPPPLYVPTTAASASASPQKQQPLFQATDGSPNYMKPTSSSHAKKELFPVSHRNTQSCSDFKNLPRKFSSDSKAACVKKPAKALTRSSSLSLVRTLTKTTSFKASRACSRKSTRAVMCADMSAPQRGTCSSTLKDSKFPAYLMLNPGGTESEGTSVMKVCPYTYCSLNGHHHDDLPPLKSFMSARRRLLKTQKRAKLEALSPRRLKIPLETEKEDSDVEQDVFDAKPACDEIGIDIFIEIYANEKDAKPTGAEEMGKIDFLKEIKDHEDNRSTIEDNGIAASEKGVMQVITPRIIGNGIPSPLISETDLEEDLKKSFDDVAIEVDIKGSFLQEQNAEDADEDHQPIVWSHEEMCMESCCSDGEQYKGDVDMDDSDSKTYDMEWEEERLNGFNHEEDADSSVYTEEDNDSKVESSSESSHDVLVTWLDDILGAYYEDFLVAETHKETKSEESTCFEEQPNGISSVLEDISESTETQEIEYSFTGMGCDQSSFTEEIFEYLTNAEDNGGENEKHVDDEASCNRKALDEETIDNTQYEKVSETCKIDETSEDGYSSSLGNNEESNKGDSQIDLFDVSEESNIAAPGQDFLEKDQGKAKRFQSTSCIGEEENTGKNWKVAIRRKRGVEDDDEMRKFNPKEPNFLPLVPEPEPEKVDLRHQMMDGRKNAEEWMLDCALRQVVTKLAPARKKKVALLVEAFETVMPAPKCETQVRNNSAFGHAGRIQACS
ncbi:calmodulin binding [Spatholobus suberectus]|nr:calmodulin binding [Spatholobus suberectus]